MALDSAGKSPDAQQPLPEKSNDVLGLKKLMDDVQKAGAEALMNPKMDLTPEQPPKDVVEIAARVARNTKDSERHKAVLPLPDRHDRKTSVEL